MMTNQLIRRFQMQGQTSEANIIISQENLRRELINQMRDEGFVPLYDIDPVWQWRWLQKDIYDFVLTMQGVHLGKEKAWQTEGISAGKAIPSTRKNKSQPS